MKQPEHRNKPVKAVIARRIVIDRMTFYYSVLEYHFDIMIRCYVEEKSAHVDCMVSYQTRWGKNVYAPLTAKKIIQYALRQGWNPLLHNDVMRIESDTIVDLLQFPEWV